MKKKEGKIIYFLGSAIISFLLLMLAYNFKINEVQQLSNKVENCLISSLLASSTVDLKVLGSTDTIKNTDFNKSYNDFIYSLKDNMNLSDDMSMKDNTLLKGRITVDTFSIYNVIGNDIEITSKNSSGNINTITINNGLGNIKTEDGILVKTTTMYAKLKFKVQGMDNILYDCEKQASTEVNHN